MPFDPRGRLGIANAFLNLAIFEDENGGDPLDVEALGQLAIVIDIDFGHDQVVSVIFSNFLHNLCRFFARASPRRPEIGEHRLARAACDFSIESAHAIDIDNLGAALGKEMKSEDYQTQDDEVRKLHKNKKNTWPVIPARSATLTVVPFYVVVQ